MTAKELETRTTEAEKDPSLVRALIADLKADGDAKLDELTQQVNATANGNAELIKARDAAESALVAANEKAASDLSEAKAKSDSEVAELQSRFELLLAEADGEIKDLQIQFNEAITQRDSVIAKGQELAAAYFTIRDKRMQLDEDYANLQSIEDALATEANRTNEERKAAEKAALIAAKEKELAELRK